jgi:hypothetical protein
LYIRIFLRKLLLGKNQMPAVSGWSFGAQHTVINADWRFTYAGRSLSLKSVQWPPFY